MVASANSLLNDELDDRLRLHNAQNNLVFHIEKKCLGVIYGIYR